MHSLCETGVDEIIDLGDLSVGVDGDGGHLALLDLGKCSRHVAVNDSVYMSKEMTCYGMNEKENELLPSDSNGLWRFLNVMMSSPPHHGRRRRCRTFWLNGAPGA